ncbi:ribonuclease P/MRP protein subunit POP5-like [Asterias rubens]|uniref:ribonuclease P/MRP protein subunit POP5-like n=1 Tax=Asterias rubens TaxID=7604 RepID=UPI0014553890|nr:ribonuclease P/MRP protein subunit POP5-like [Asterias rubens]
MVRLKNRYFLCEMVFEDPNSRAFSIVTQNIYAAVKSKVRDTHGDYGLAAISWGLSVRYLNSHTGLVMIRVRRHHQKILGSTLPFITSIARCPLSLRTIHVSGTIRSCQKFLVKFNRQQLVVLLRQCKTKEERIQVKESIKKCSVLAKEKKSHNTASGNTSFS